MTFDSKEISGELWQRLTQADMSVADAVRYLNEVPKVARSIGETLRAMRPGVDIVDVLRSFYLELDPTQKHRSLTKRLQNWMADRNPPTNRMELFRIAFALQLREEELDFLLSILDGYGIQYRDAHEVVYAWFLNHGLPYAEATDFIESLPSSTEDSVLCDEAPSHVTREVAKSFSSVTTLEELWLCYKRNLGLFGSLHLRAYWYFERYLERLIQPDPPEEMPEERRYSIKTVMDTYLALRMPASRNRTGLTPVQRLIKQNWPNETVLKDIRAHKVDVPRKLLLLLYVVTENEGFEDSCVLGYRFRDHWIMLDAMLDDCGMALLDMRNAFDWLILYSTAVHGDETMSERMEAVISELYG